MVLLENVRNIAGPRHTHEWDVIIRSLRDLGYRVRPRPDVFSPHLLPPERGGRPQVRERVFIMATYVGEEGRARRRRAGRPARAGRRLEPHALGRGRASAGAARATRSAASLRLRLSASETTWVEAWNDFVVTLRAAGVEQAPGFPVWVDAFVHEDDLMIEDGTPDWKANFLRKNSAFYTEHQEMLEGWLGALGLPARLPCIATQVRVAGPGRRLTRRDDHAPAALRSARQAGHVCAGSGRDHSDQHPGRPPASHLASRGGPAAGPPEWFDFGDQPDAATYKQMGNGVNVGAAYHVFREHVLANLRAVTRAMRPAWQRQCAVSPEPGSSARAVLGPDPAP